MKKKKLTVTDFRSFLNMEGETPWTVESIITIIFDLKVTVLALQKLMGTKFTFEQKELERVRGESQEEILKEFLQIISGDIHPN